MDNRQQDASEVKTHDEIMRLFKDVESIEEKVKNFETFEKEFKRAQTFLQEIGPVKQHSEKPAKEQPPLEPAGEIPLQKDEEERLPFWKKKQKPEIPTKEKPHRFSFLKRNIKDQPELTAAPEIEEPLQEVIIPRSTFILQFDAEGNLIGLPLKKSTPETQKTGFFSRRKHKEGSVETQEEEPVEGFKGKLKHLTARFHRKSSSEAESGTGIGDKIKGIFRRKSKE